MAGKANHQRKMAKSGAKEPAGHRQEENVNADRQRLPPLMPGIITSPGSATTLPISKEVFLKQVLEEVYSTIDVSMIENAGLPSDRAAKPISYERTQEKEEYGVQCANYLRRIAGSVCLAKIDWSEEQWERAVNAQGASFKRLEEIPPIIWEKITPEGEDIRFAFLWHASIWDKDARRKLTGNPTVVAKLIHEQSSPNTLLECRDRKGRKVFSEYAAIRYVSKGELLRARGIMSLAWHWLGIQKQDKRSADSSDRESNQSSDNKQPGIKDGLKPDSSQAFEEIPEKSALRKSIGRPREITDEIRARVSELDCNDRTDAEIGLYRVFETGG